jgi:hypothetical protein
MILAMLNSNAWADETQINLDPQTPYVDIPIEATELTQITIQTTNGTPQTNPGFIDSRWNFGKASTNYLQTMTERTQPQMFWPHI